MINRFEVSKEESVRDALENMELESLMLQGLLYTAATAAEYSPGEIGNWLGDTMRLAEMIVERIDMRLDMHYAEICEAMKAVKA